MNNDAGKILLNSFFVGCEREFRFLEQERGFAYLSGLEEFCKGHRVFTPWSPDKLLLATMQGATLYEKNGVSFEILYNTKDYALSFYVCHDQIHRFEFSEILKAMRRSLFVDMETVLVSRHDVMEKALQKAAYIVRQNIECLDNPEVRVIERALQARQKIMEQKLRDKLQRDIHDAAQQATKAFLEKDYRRVVELFTPYEHHLSFSDMRKLDIARQALLSV